MQKLTINSKEYPIKSGYGAIRIFCQRRKIEFYQFFERFEGVQVDKLTLENVEDFAYLVIAFIDRGCELDSVQNDLTVNDVIDWIGEDPSNMTKVIELLSGNFAEASEQKKTKAKRRD